MSRLTFLLALALGLGACDSSPSAPPAEAAPSPVASMNRSGDSAPFQITNDASVWVDGETVVLDVDGRRIEVSAGVGYVIGQALARAGFDALDEGVKKQFPDYEPGNDKGYPTAGDGGIRFKGIIFGGGKVPPPPPPPDWDPGLLKQLLGGTAEVVEIPKGLDFEKGSGGWIGR